MRGGRDNAEEMVRREWRGATEPGSTAAMSFAAASASSATCGGAPNAADEAECRCDFAAAATFLESARRPPYAAKLLLLAEARAWAACGEGTGMATIWVGWGRGWRHGRDGLSVL